MKAWHFLREENGVPVYRDGAPASVGQTLRHDGPMVMCESGLHASERIIDAVKYASGSWVCEVKCGGERIEQADKLVCRERTILRMANIGRELREFACGCAERALALVPNPDPRSVAAIAARRAWMRGEITDAALDAAVGDAVGDAARAAGDAQNIELERVVREKFGKE